MIKRKIDFAKLYLVMKKRKSDISSRWAFIFSVNKAYRDFTG
jgi:hypothetical protein